MLRSEYTNLSVVDIREGLNAGNFSAKEIADASLSCIDALDAGVVDAFLSTTPMLAYEAAEKLDTNSAKSAQVKAGILAGVPIAFKDNMNLMGTHTTCASKMLADYISPYTATCVAKTLAAGAIPMGKLNMDEFAFGSSTETSAFKLTRNPWDLERVPGGSSGGSVAAVASGMVTVALGSDTGGSIRQPAAFCGVVGFKPTYGVVSRYGVVAFGSSLDQVGPIGRSVADVAITTDAICGRDPLDCTSQDVNPGYYNSVLAAQQKGIKGMKIGVVPEYLEAPGIEREVVKALKGAIANLQELGAQIVDVSLPNAQAALAAYYVIGPCEAFSNLSRFDSVRYGNKNDVVQTAATDLGSRYEQARAHGFGPEAIRRIMLGSYLLSSGVYNTYYYPAQQVRTLITKDYQQAFEQVDVILAPVSPRTAFKFGEVGDPTSMYLSDIFTIPINIAGNGGLSLPVGLGEDSGLPVAVQIIGPQFGDYAIMRAAAALEQCYPDIRRIAPLMDSLNASANGLKSPERGVA
ncbi:MAG: Asp-tRNA(Asn)/Glu-tRNA(Gln) amidotransferase subunit GatA [Coriobacteriales bacterium]|jgi:aspartyl-tRNA(Asn)/glutamyl-tRNA(Gln) amidotransferase subunit A|nr:Asp-tRNA(Asn)/Glu-tRNA(Gln) amidotransferase subunit GatA [Coriobacteriales bacterium]